MPTFVSGQLVLVTAYTGRLLRCVVVEDAGRSTVRVRHEPASDQLVDATFSVPRDRVRPQEAERAVCPR